MASPFELTRRLHRHMTRGSARWAPGDTVIVRGAQALVESVSLEHGGPEWTRYYGSRPWGGNPIGWYENEARGTGYPRLGVVGYRRARAEHHAAHLARLAKAGLR